MAFKKRFWIALTSLIVLPAIVLIAGIYQFNFTNNDIYIELADGEVVEYDQLMREAEEMGYSKVMLSLFSIRTLEDFTLFLPRKTDTLTPVLLTDIKKQEMQRWATGKYSMDEKSGNIDLNYDTIQTINVGIEDNKRVFTAPFSVSSQTSNPLFYLGLFIHDTQEHTIKHVDSVFIDESINILTIEPGHQKKFVSITFNRGDDSKETESSQSMTIEKQYQIAINPTRFTK
ncbi:hypothetical protein [Neptunomonas sp.]|uniref:hypothetical protein n=1 Tax=Neptunomonas sp. TaxID=1971898 RepID=UPI0025FC0574|nr:hypothetical protein [Neptunomonas sp.]